MAAFLEDIKKEETLKTGQESPVDKEKQVQELVTDGKELYDKAKESNFDADNVVPVLTSSLKSLVDASLEAAGEHLAEAVSYIQLFFTGEVPDSISSQLPSDLLAVAQIVTEGTNEEREIFSIACEMFDIMSQGSDYIKRDDFVPSTERLLTAEGKVTQKLNIRADKLKNLVKRLLHCGLTSNEKGERITTKEAFCLVACRYARGETLMQSLEDETAAELSSEQLKNFKKSNWIKKVTDFPAETSRYLGYYVLSTIEKYGIRWIWSLFPIRQFVIVLLVYLIPLINIEFILSVLATLVFTASLLVMVITTLQVVANSSKVSSFKDYSKIFTYFARKGRDINTRDPEMKVIFRSAFPYITFTLSLLATMFTIKVAYQQLLIYELLLVITGAMTIIVFFKFGIWKSPLVLLSLSTRLLSWGLVFMSVFRSWFPLPDFLFALNWTMLSIPILPWGVSLNINLITLIQVPLHIVLIAYFLIRYSWKNFFIGLGPYLLFVSWWIFTRYIFSHSSIVSLLVFIPGVLSLLLFIPFLPLLIVLAPFIMMLYYGFSVQFLLSFGLLVVASIAGLLIMFNYQRIKEANWLNIPLDYIFLIHFIVGISLVFIGTLYYNSFNISSSSSSLEMIPFKDYNQMCGLDHSLPGNTLQAQLNCYHLKGRTISVEGAIVEEIKLIEVSNSQLLALKNFPLSVQSALTCLMGETIPFCGNLLKSKTCVFRGCHFDYANHYSVGISVKLPSLASNAYPLYALLTTQISHKLLLNSSLLNLKHGNTLSFNATLLDGLGTRNLSLKLISFICSETGLKYEQNINGTMAGHKKQVLDRAWESTIVTTGFVAEVLVGFSPTDYYKS